MTPFRSFLVVDWSAARRRPARPSPDAIWLGFVQDGTIHEPIYCRSRRIAERRIRDIVTDEIAAGRRLLATFDFPFGYPMGFARTVTGHDDPLLLWDWLEARITDDAEGVNNRFDVAERINALFDGPGPFWAKTHRDRWPGIPCRKAGIVFDPVAEWRLCDRIGRTSSSCFQLNYPPTVGGQVLMGLPMLARLRRQHGVAVWPFGAWRDSPVVLAEIRPGAIERAVKSAMARIGGTPIHDAVQVRLLALALSRLKTDDLERMMTGLLPEAQEEGWILGCGHGVDLCGDLCALVDSGQAAIPPLRNDCFALPAGIDWTPVDDALAMLRDRLRPVAGIGRARVQDVLGLVLAQPAQARRSHPPTANSAVDGYGFAHAALPAGDAVLPLMAGRAAAGMPHDGAVPHGHAIRILTGATLPEGVDTVVLQEDVSLGAGQIAFRGGLKPGANARRAGEDVTEGEAVLPEGRVLTPADLALLSAVGVAEVAVRERLRVAVISTGDELAEPGTDAGVGQIFDANRPMLLGLLRQMGFQPVDMGRIPDDRAALRRAFDQAAGAADAILTSGGASAGDEDHVSALLNETGAMAQWRIALKPGRPLALAMWQGRPVFGLPGNPVAALVCTLIFARPALGVLAGAGWSGPQGYDLPAAFEKRKKPGRREYLRARLREGRVEVFASEGSGRISGLSWAEGLVELGDDACHIRPGDPVRYIPYSSFLM